MAKVFNVEQIRLNNKLLTGNSAGELWFDGTKLAAGSTAVPLTRSITFGDGIRFYDASVSLGFSASEDLSANRTVKLVTDDSTIGFSVGTHPQIIVKDGGIGINQISSSIAGAGLEGGGGNALAVTAGSGIEVASDAVNIKPEGVLNSMLSGEIADGKLNTITTAGKVQGGAVTLEDTSLATGAGAGLKINDQGVNVQHIHTSVAGLGLAGGNGSAIDVGVVSGLAVNSSQVGIAESGVTNSHLFGNISDTKLNTISTSEKVYGDAIKLEGSTLSVTSNGLHVSDGGITATQIATSAAGDGLGGGGGAALFVNAGSGIAVTGDNVNIAETGIVNSMIANGTITEGKLAGSIGADKLNLTAGDGLDLSTNTLSVDLVASNPGLEISSQKLQVDDTVVRADSTANQTLSGTYSFKETVNLLSGLVVDGDLEIRGNTTVTQSNEVQIGDALIVLNHGYAGSAAPDGGIEVERGTADNAKLVFDDDTPYVDGGDKWMAGVGSNMYRIETKEYSRTYSLEMNSGIGGTGVLFGHTFESVPNVVVSVQHTGKYSVANPDMLFAQVTGVTTSGVDIALTADTPHSGYFLNIHATVS